MPADNLADALERMAAGDKLAFNFVYRATRAKLYGIVTRILKRREIADEVLQEVYVKIWRSAGKFDPAIATPIAWMASIARNHALDEVRRKTMYSIEDFPELLDVAADGTPHASLEESEERRRLANCLDKLDPKRKQALLLAYSSGLTREEIAQKFDIPSSTVRTWIRRSLALIKECLAR